MANNNTTCFSIPAIMVCADKIMPINDVINVRDETGKNSNTFLPSTNMFSIFLNFFFFCCVDSNTHIDASVLLETYTSHNYADALVNFSHLKCDWNWFEIERN